MPSYYAVFVTTKIKLLKLLLLSSHSVPHLGPISKLFSSLCINSVLFLGFCISSMLFCPFCKFSSVGSRLFGYFLSYFGSLCLVCLTGFSLFPLSIFVWFFSFLNVLHLLFSLSLLSCVLSWSYLMPMINMDFISN